MSEVLQKRYAKVCAWCPPEKRRKQERQAESEGLEVSHAMCPMCREAMLREAAAANPNPER